MATYGGTGQGPIFGLRATQDEAERWGIDTIGTCDWGKCDEETWGVRWCPRFNAYLSVCWACSQAPDHCLDDDPGHPVGRLQAL